MTNRRLLLISIGVISIAIIGFTTIWLTMQNVANNKTNPQRSAIDLIELSVIQLSDLPAGWNKTEYVDASTSEATGRFYRFYATSDPAFVWVNVGQKILVFANQDKAKSGFADWKSKYTAVDGIPGQKIDFSLALHADQLAVRCLPINVNGLSTLDCALVARYQNVMVLVLTSVFEDRVLTMSDYQSVLATMDRRITDALAK